MDEENNASPDFIAGPSNIEIIAPVALKQPDLAEPISPQGASSTLKPKPKKRFWRFFSFLLAALIVGGSAYAYSLYAKYRDQILDSSNTTEAASLGLDNSNINSSLNPANFPVIGSGRYSILLLGVDKAAGLTDSIQVMSFDTINKTSTITSIPRDFYVNLKSPAYAGKINAVFNLAEAKSKGSGGKTIKELVGSILGTPISHYITIDFTGLTKVIDTLGGIDINVPDTIYDPLYPADSGTGYQIFQMKEGLQHMDGKTALKYSRSRQTTSDFSRSGRQQLVIQGIKEKALTKGIITSPTKVLELLNTLASNVRTDLTTDQIKALATVYNSVNASNQKSAVLDTSAELGLLTSLNDPQMGYVAYPHEGMTDYSMIQRWYRFQNPDPLIAKDKPSVTVLNGGYLTTKQVKTTIDTLIDYGYTVFDAAGQSLNQALTPSPSPSPSSSTSPKVTASPKATSTKTTESTRITIKSLSDITLTQTLGKPASNDPLKTKNTELYSLSKTKTIMSNYLAAQFSVTSKTGNQSYKSDFVLYLGTNLLKASPSPTPSPTSSPKASPSPSPYVSP